MAVIINIRGTGGSGKSYVVYHIIKKLGIKNKIVKNDRPGYRKGNNVVGYRLNGDVLIVGKYETDCGGCDQIKFQDEICDRVYRFAKKSSVVLFEGLLISGLYSRYLQLSRKLQKENHEYIWAFLDTSLDECLKRTVRRRIARGNKKPFNPKNTELKYRAVTLAKEHALRDKENVITLHSGRAHKQLLRLVRKYYKI